jgi:hypothetical protein
MVESSYAASSSELKLVLITNFLFINEKHLSTAPFVFLVPYYLVRLVKLYNV